MVQHLVKFEASNTRKTTTLERAAQLRVRKTTQLQFQNINFLRPSIEREKRYKIFNTNYAEEDSRGEIFQQNMIHPNGNSIALRFAQSSRLDRAPLPPLALQRSAHESAEKKYSHHWTDEWNQ